MTEIGWTIFFIDFIHFFFFFFKDLTHCVNLDLYLIFGESIQATLEKSYQNQVVLETFFPEKGNQCSGHGCSKCFLTWSSTEDKLCTDLHHQGLSYWAWSLVRCLLRLIVPGVKFLVFRKMWSKTDTDVRFFFWWGQNGAIKLIVEKTYKERK